MVGGSFLEIVFVAVSLRETKLHLAAARWLLYTMPERRVKVPVADWGNVRYRDGLLILDLPLPVEEP